MSVEIKKTVAVVGAGISGLCAIKECLAEGFAVDAFEARPEIGGQWAYQAIPDGFDGEVQSSMYDGVVVNSCRDTTAFTDFPLDPARYGEYFGHRQMLQYVQEYAHHFKLAKHVRLRTRVLACTQTADDRWAVRFQEDGKAEPEEAVYDAVLAAPGVNTTPRLPEFKGREAFTGEFLHSHYYRNPARFRGKRVVIIGLGSASLDISCELAPLCSEVHIVTRRGAWVIPRYVLGKPAEAWDNRASQTWVPLSIQQSMLKGILNLYQGEHPEDIRPDHKILEQNPQIRSEFLEKVRSGIIKTHRAEVDYITEDGIQLSNGTRLEADVIISATGYEPASIPYLPSDVVRTADTPKNEVDLWKLIVSPRYPNLFLLGMVELAGPLPAPAEAQCRLVVAALSGRVQLPDRATMEKEIKEWQAFHAKNFVKSERHALTTHYIPYVDGLLAPLGANPTMGRLLGQVFTGGSPLAGLKTLGAVYFGITNSAQWRLFGHGRKTELARETLFRIADGKDELSKGELKYL
ncbi:flavin-containing monooxygenase [Xylariomycetidae sp. FL2044]|nr:flavin-containing monooxygenase [Xylariomycetidae sp. FL2044]